MEENLVKTEDVDDSSHVCRSNIFIIIGMALMIVAYVFAAFSFEWDTEFDMPKKGEPAVENRSFYQYYVFAGCVFIVSFIVITLEICCLQDLGMTRLIIGIVFGIVYVIFAAIMIIFTLMLDYVIRVSKTVLWSIGTASYGLSLFQGMWGLATSCCGDKDSKTRSFFVALCVFGENLFNFLCFLFVVLIYTGNLNMRYIIPGVFKLIAEIFERIKQLVEGKLIHNLGAFLGILCIAIPGVCYILMDILIPLREDRTITTHTAILAIPLYVYLLYNIVLLLWASKYTYNFKQAIPIKKGMTDSSEV